MTDHGAVEEGSSSRRPRFPLGCCTPRQIAELLLHGLDRVMKFCHETKQHAYRMQPGLLGIRRSSGTNQDAALDDRRRMPFGACGELWVPSTDHAGVLKGRSRERECGSAWIGSGQHILEVQDVLAEGVVPARGGR